jgi:hypothetical protein
MPGLRQVQSLTGADDTRIKRQFGSKNLPSASNKQPGRLCIIKPKRLLAAQNKQHWL